MQSITTLAALQTDPDALLTPEQTAPFRGGTLATLARDRWARAGIPYVKLGRRPFYRAGDVLEWIKSRRVTTFDSNRKVGAS